MNIEQLVNNLPEIRELPRLEVGELITVTHIAHMGYREKKSANLFYILGVFNTGKDRPNIVCVDAKPNGLHDLQLLDRETLNGCNYLDLKRYYQGTKIVTTQKNGFILVPPEI